MIQNEEQIEGDAGNPMGLMVDWEGVARVPLNSNTAGSQQSESIGKSMGEGS